MIQYGLGKVGATKGGIYIILWRYLCSWNIVQYCEELLATQLPQVSNLRVENSTRMQTHVHIYIYIYIQPRAHTPT